MAFTRLETGEIRTMSSDRDVTARAPSGERSRREPSPAKKPWSTPRLEIKEIKHTFGLHGAHTDSGLALGSVPP
jgi:hypothetical protein